MRNFKYGLSLFLAILKKVSVFLISYFILTFPSFSIEPPDIEWESTYNRVGNDFLACVQQTRDGGFIIGSTTPNKSSRYEMDDFCLIKTDNLGNKQWEKLFGGDQTEICKVVHQVEDGYIVGGTTYSYGAGSQDMYLIKTDSQGNVDWQKTYGDTGENYCQWVNLTNSGGFILTGSSNSGIYVVKTDDKGNIEWENKYSLSNQYGQGYWIEQTKDSGYIVIGYVEFYDNGRNIKSFILKIDRYGNHEWIKFFDNTKWLQCVKETNDGGFIVVGILIKEVLKEPFDSDIYLLKTDMFGNVLWEKTFGDSYLDNAFFLQITQDGGFVISATIEKDENWNYYLYVIRTDSSGNILWKKEVTYTAFFVSNWIQLTNDGGFVVSGVKGNADNCVYVAKLSPEVYIQFPPPNDNFSNACEIWGSVGKITGTNVNATKERGEPNHCGNQGGKSVWYKWQAPASGPCFFDTYGSTFDTLLAIYSGNFVNALRHIASNDDDEGSPQSLVSFDVRAESEYNIAIDGKNGDSGNIVLSWILNSIDVTTPFPGDDWLRGTVNDITWATTGSPGSDVRITLWKNNQFYSAITCNTENDGSYPWRIPTSIPIGSDYKIRVTSNSNNKIYDFVDSNFSISEPLRVTSPNGKEDWRVGKMKHITWDSSDKIGSSVRITLWKGNQYYTTIIRDTLNTGSYFWTIPKSVPPGSDYRVRITSNSDYSIYDFSDNYFTISSLITVTSPNGGENWLRGTSKNITWTTTADVNLNVRITIWKDNQYFTTITNGTENDGTYCWTIPKTLPTGSDYRIRITSLLDESVYDFSDDYFSIKFGIIVTSPNGGENWVRGMTKDIMWTSDCGENSYVNITLWKGGTLYLTIINHTQDSGSYSWAIPSSMLVGSDYKIRITSTSDSTIFDLSDNYFSITPGVL